MWQWKGSGKNIPNSSSIRTPDAGLPWPQPQGLFPQAAERPVLPRHQDGHHRQHDNSGGDIHRPPGGKPVARRRGRNLARGISSRGSHGRKHVKRAGPTLSDKCTPGHRPKSLAPAPSRGNAPGPSLQGFVTPYRCLLPGRNFQPRPGTSLNDNGAGGLKQPGCPDLQESGAPTLGGHAEPLPAHAAQAGPGR